MSSVKLRQMLARIPTAAWICAAVALLNGTTWSLLTPPFQGRDEPAHFAYAQRLAETGSLPHASAAVEFSPAEERALEGLHQPQIKLAPEVPAISSISEQRTLVADLEEELSRVGSGSAGVATRQPPLYYAIETIPYAFGGNPVTQLQLMRLLGALFAAITVLLVFFFLRELLPTSPGTVTAATACVAVQPLFGFMSGTLNPDNMLYTVSAGVLFCLARAFRRGLTQGLAIALGVLIAVGFATKLNFIGVSLGAFLGIALLGIREYKSGGRKTLRPPLLASGIGLIPVALYMMIDSLFESGTLWSEIWGLVTFKIGGFYHELSYIWEFYLPKLPGMHNYFLGTQTFRYVWFDRSVGLYGWLDTMFPEWVENLAIVPVACVVILAGRYLVTRRQALHARLPELITYASLVLGILVMVGHSAFASYLSVGAAAFADPRYLLPLLPLLAALVALAIRGAGNWAPAIAAVLVILFLAHDLFSQMQVIARYYG